MSLRLSSNGLGVEDAEENMSQSCFGETESVSYSFDLELFYRFMSEFCFIKKI